MEKNRIKQLAKQTALRRVGVNRNSNVTFRFHCKTPSVERGKIENKHLAFDKF